MADDFVNFLLRLPKEMKAQIANTAAKNRRTMTGEILHTLDRNIGKATGGNFGERAPAAEINGAALASGASITQGIGAAADDYRKA